jgi:ABC-type oligopeptide transport system substrate-binding subunit
VAAAGTRVWIATTRPNRVAELDVATSRRPSTTALSGQPTATVTAGGSAWVTTVPPIMSRTGATRSGVVTVALNTGIDSIDPAVAQWATSWQLEYATGLRLLSYPDRSGPAGDHLVPDAATAMPHVSNGGRTHTFTVRRGLRFWPGREPVTAAAFRAAVERALSPGVDAQFGYDFMSDLAGVRAYRRGRAPHVSGIRLLGRYRISFTTVQPDPAFDVYIAMPMYAAVPPETPDQRATQALPSAGPYYIAAYDPGRLILLRQNRGYRGPRPALAVEIRYLLGGPNAEPAWQQVADGRADVDADPATPMQLATLRATPEMANVHVRIDPAPVVRYLLFNTRSPAMRDPRVRRAVANAIDREALAATTGTGGATPTDQYLTPSLAGYPGDGHVYPLNQARPHAASRLLRAAGVRLPLTLRLSTCNDRNCVADGAPARVALLRAELARIGIRLVVLDGSRLHQFQADLSGGFDIADEGFVFPTSDPAGVDYPIRSEAHYGPTASLNKAEQARYPRRAAAWRALDLALVRGPAPLAAFAIGDTITLASRRVGCLVYQPEYGLDLGRLCPVG